MNTILIAIADEFDGNSFVVNSKDNRMFFENRDRGMNTSYYRVLGSVNVEESKFQECLVKMQEISDSIENIKDIMRKSDKIYIDYDYKFRAVTDRKKLYQTYGITEEV